MQLSIVIVNYNVRRFLYQCLRSVEKAIAGMEADVWVVDNTSKDGSVEFLEPLFPEAHFIRNSENVGFSIANNQAIRQSKGKFVLLLNPDTIVTPDALRQSVEWMEQNPKAGATGVALHNSNGSFARESRRGVPTPLVSFCKITGLIKLFPRHRTIGRYYMGYLDRNKASEIEILSGAYMMLRREAIDKVGSLDEDFFMYGEDIDLSYRLLKGGWRNFYLPQPIIHYKGESEHPSTIRYVNVFHSAMIIFYQKNFAKKYFLSGFLIRLAVYLSAFVCLLKHAWQWFAGLFPKHENQPVVYCLTTDSHRQAIQSAAESQGLQCRFVDDVSTILSKDAPSLNTSKARHCYLLFDATQYDYKQMIDTIVEANNRNLCLQLATYHPEIGILIP